MKARARWVFERASNAFAHCGRFLRSRRNLTSFSLPSFSWKVFRLGTRGKKIARARDPNESSDAGENESRRFFSRARIVLRVRAILARVVVVVAARARLQISKGERWGRSRRNVSHVRSRKNPKNARVASSAPFSCRPSIAQNSYREASSKMVSRANSPSPRKTRRRVNTPILRAGGVSLPPTKFVQMLLFLFFCVCVLVGFFCLVFRGVDACWPSKQENLPFFCVIILVAAPQEEILFFCGI